MSSTSHESVIKELTQLTKVPVVSNEISKTFVNRLEESCNFLCNYYWSCCLITLPVTACLGLLLCFAGRRFFRASIATIGGLLFALVSFALNASIPDSLTDTKLATLIVVSFIVGAILTASLYKVGVCSVGVAAGIVLTVALSDMLKPILTSNAMNDAKSYVLTILGICCIAVCVFLVFKFEKVMAVLTTAACGAALVCFAIDICFNTSMFSTLVLAFKNSTIPVSSTDAGLCAFMIALAVSGVVVQFLGMRQKRRN